MFEGICIGRKGSGVSETFTVRKMSAGIGVERIFPVHSPKIAKITVVRKASDENRLSALSVQGYVLSPSFNQDTEEYSITVNATKTTLKPTDVTAIAKDSTATVVKDAELTLVANEYVPYKVTVTSATGKTKVYTIRVKKPYSSDATLSGVT